jgi:hypothetical protein
MIIWHRNNLYERKRWCTGEPISSAFLIATEVAALAGGGYAMSAQNTAAKAQKTYYENQAARRQQEAELARKAADRNIENTQLQASQEAKQLAMKTGAVVGSQKAALAASGVGGGSVTAADITTDTFDKSKLDEIAIRYNADSRSSEYENDARNAKWAADVDSVQLKAAGKNAIRAGRVEQASTLLNTATSMASTAASASNLKSPRALKTVED